MEENPDSNKSSGKQVIANLRLVLLTRWRQINTPPKISARGRQEVEALNCMRVKLTGFINGNAEGVVQQSPG